MACRSLDTASSAKRTRILEAAAAVVARRGFDAARMEEIASAAQVSKGTLYRFFQSKEELFIATVLEAYARGRRMVEAEAPASGDPRARLEGHLRALANAFPMIASQMTVNFQAWGVVARDRKARARLFAELREIYARRSAEIEETLRAGQRARIFRRDLDAEKSVSTLLATFDGFLYRSTFDPHNAGPRQLEAAFAAWVSSILSEEGEPEPPGRAGRG